MEEEIDFDDDPLPEPSLSAQQAHLHAEHEVRQRQEYLAQQQHLAQQQQEEAVVDMDYEAMRAKQLHAATKEASESMPNPITRRKVGGLHTPAVLAARQVKVEQDAARQVKVEQDDNVLMEGRSEVWGGTGGDYDPWAADAQIDKDLDNL
jgi:hypothetical protein